ncbi:MAG: bifunctional [glutamate--ammonia ligase]-adenylyl-L-tyrosine phosphorylase/[glutamate--ammonia-ligase] adenylyltransferase [Polyangiaceae bacterium]
MIADDIAPGEAADARAWISSRLAAIGEPPVAELVELGALLACAYPALARAIDAHPEDLAAVAQSTGRSRGPRAYRRLAAAALGDLSDSAGMMSGLRRFASREKLRVAARELLAHPGQDVDVTARELSDLADVCCEFALAEALGWAEARFGEPLTSAGEPCAFVVIGMGKLGGRELNAGSDVDLLLFYETDDGFVRPRDGTESSHTLHEHFTRVAQRLIATLDLATDDGVVWRVDLRLRPEGVPGPLVNALVAAERYYETWGRTWERAALIRARPVAGDLRFGQRLLETLAPFVWRQAVDPSIVEEMAAMLFRARAEAGPAATQDLKIGPGGIREVEFFAQGLQLVWGGREPGVRAANTIDAMRRLHGRGFVTEREQRELVDGYFFLRRLEHRVQFATGLQTHEVPRDFQLLGRVARSRGFGGAAALTRELADVRARVSARFATLQPAGSVSEDPSFERLWAALDAGDELAVTSAAAERFGAAASTDLPRHLMALARRPDGPLGAATRDRDSALARLLIEALADAADPEQAARLLAAFFARFVTPGTYLRALTDEPRLVRALCSLLGASAFLGEALVAHPDLVDRVLYTRALPTPEAALALVSEEISALSPEASRDVGEFVGALRRAKRRVTFEVGLADLAGQLRTREVGHVLTALADSTLEHAFRFAIREQALEPLPTPHDDATGFALIAMGKLGGREIGYGSDLDLLFVYEASEDAAPERYSRVAQRVLRLVETPHGEGPGYVLDTRLRPSGSQGLLVVSLAGFARYQEQRAQDWERQALVKARACAGDAALGARVVAIAHEAAYERGAPDPERTRRLRVRVERELGHERIEPRPARYDVKVGRGGIVDVEFAAQWLQMLHGRDPRVRTTDTEIALSALETCGYLEPSLAESLREGWHFLRRLEQRLRVSQGSSSSLIEEGAPGLVTLARRMGMRDSPRAQADRALLERYLSVTSEVRSAFLSVLGLDP